MVAALIGELAKLRNQVKEKVKDSASSLKCIRTLYNTMNRAYLQNSHHRAVADLSTGDDLKIMDLRRLFLCFTGSLPLGSLFMPVFGLV